MYTHCPHCNTWFAVSAAHLRTGHGEVRCGRCIQPFDALLELTDRRPAGQVLDNNGSTPEPAAEQPAPPAASGVPLLDQAQAPADSGSAAHAVPEVLREDLALIQAVRRARRSRTWFAAASLLLTLALATQYAWFNATQVVQYYPQVRPALDWLCRHSACELPASRDLAKIQMLSRDVRIHPRYEGALQVRASIVNTAAFQQSFPQLEFTLFNVNGQIIATRLFTAADYLDTPELQTRGMLPRVPAQLTLDLLAPEQAAVSFEFRFL